MVFTSRPRVRAPPTTTKSTDDDDGRRTTTQGAMMPSVFAPEISRDDGGGNSAAADADSDANGVARGAIVASRDAGVARGGARAARRKRATTMSALWSMTQAYALLIVVVLGYNAIASAFRPNALDLSPEGMMLAGGVDPSVVARSNASAFRAKSHAKIMRAQTQASMLKHTTRVAIRGSFNSAARLTTGTASGALSVAGGVLNIGVGILERVGLGILVEGVTAVATTAGSSVQNVVWLVTFASSPAVDYGLLPLYEFVMDGLEPLYMTFVTGTMEKFEDMTFALEQNLAAVMHESVLSKIRYPLHVVLNPFKWPLGVYETILRPAYVFAAYPEYYDDVPDPVAPIAKRSFGERCRASVWGEWTTCSVECGQGFKVRMNHCGKREYARCVGTGVIGCDGKCNSGRSADCNGICGGKAVVDKCGTCGGMNIGLGCDGKCFSGKREDTLGNCCDASSITSSGMCSSDAGTPSHLKSARDAKQNSSKSTAPPKKKVSFIRRIINLFKFMLVLVLRIVSIIVRAISFAIQTVLRSVLFVFSVLFSGAMLKLLGTMTLGFVVLGVVDKKAQENVAMALKQNVPFIGGEDSVDDSQTGVKATEATDEEKTFKKRAENAVKKLIELLKRSDEVPGTVQHYAKWLNRRALVRIQMIVPWLLAFVSDDRIPTPKEVMKVREEMEDAKLLAEELEAEIAELKNHVQRTMSSEEEKTQALNLADYARKEAEQEKKRALEKAEKTRAELERIKAETEKAQAAMAKDAAARLAAEKASLDAEKARKEAEQARLKMERDLERAKTESDLIRQAAEKEVARVTASHKKAEARIALLEKEAIQAHEEATRQASIASAEVEHALEKVQTFESANLTKRNALTENKSAMKDMKEYAEKLVTFFVKHNEEVFTAAKALEVSEYASQINTGNVVTAVASSVGAGGEIPKDVLESFLSLRKYRARRNSVLALVKLTRNHPSIETRTRCWEALQNLANGSLTTVRVLMRCEAMSNAMIDILEWSCGAAEEDGCPYEAMEFVHAMVSNKFVTQDQTLREQIADPVHARCILAVLKTVPHNNSVQGMGLGTLWQLVRMSKHGAEMQGALLADGLIRHIVDTCEPARENVELARVTCGCALALALNNTSVQDTMLRVGMPRLLVGILSAHESIDFRGEFTKLSAWLTANAR